MVNSIWQLLSIKTKLTILAIILFIILLFICIFKYQSYKISTLTKEVTVCEITNRWEKAVYVEELNKAKLQIDIQNKTINDFIISKTDYELVVSEKEKELLVNKIKKQEGIKRELELDSSPENQLKIIKVLLEEFSENN